jgi:hypothetical protein
MVKPDHGQSFGRISAPIRVFSNRTHLTSIQASGHENANVRSKVQAISPQIAFRPMEEYKAT